MKKNDSVKKVLKNLTTVFIIVLVVKVFFGFCYGMDMISDKNQRMKKIDYDVCINDDGSMTVVETWNILISHTNTLFKNFDKSDKYGEIINVSVKDIKANKELTQIYEEMYHVTDDCYYALDTKAGLFEIAWGTGMENSFGNKKYQITYTVTDVIKEYQDCQELYWMFLSNTNEVYCERVTGIVRLPKRISNMDNLRIWGHGPLNGKIVKKSNDTIEFTINNLSTNRMLEIRIASLEKLIDRVSYNNTFSYNYLNSIISEETKWADEANSQSNLLWSIFTTPISIIVFVYLFYFLYNILKTIQYRNMLNSKIQKRIVLDYYRDIPRDGSSTPMESEYLYYFNKSLKEGGKYQSNGVAAVILDLALKQYITLRSDGENTFIKIIKSDEGLKKDEKAIYKILKKVGKNEEFNIDLINKYAKKDYYEYSQSINNMVNYAREELYNEHLVDKAERRLYQKSKQANGIFKTTINAYEFIFFWMIISILPIIRNLTIIPIRFVLICTLISIPLGITIIMKNKVLGKIQNKIAVLTEKGNEERAQWKGLAKFLEDFSNLDEATVPDLALWEKYLVFATAFGIAEKVIEQMKAKYPDVFVEEYWSDEIRNQYPILEYSLYNTIYYHRESYNPINHLSQSAGTAYHISKAEIAAHTSSSGSGGGGGFSGGGGGRRRRRRNGRKIVLPNPQNNGANLIASLL